MGLLKKKPCELHVFEHEADAYEAHRKTLIEAMQQDKDFTEFKKLYKKLLKKYDIEPTNFF